MTHELPPPVVNADSAPYWDAARKGKLAIRACQTCGHKHFMPRAICPNCWSDDLAWIEASGNGHVHSFTIIRRAPLPSFAARVPYVVALIDLAEGPRMMANIVGNDALTTEIGDPVLVTFEKRGDAAIPQFALNRSAKA